MSAPGGGESIEIDAEIAPLLAKLQQLDEVASSLRTGGVGDRPTETLAGLQSELEELFNPEIVRRFGRATQEAIQEAVTNGFRNGFERGTENLAKIRSTLSQATSQASSQTPQSVLSEIEAARLALRPGPQRDEALGGARASLRGLSPEILRSLSRPLQEDITGAVEHGFQGGLTGARRIFKTMGDELRDQIGLGLDQGLQTPGKTAQARKAARDEPSGSRRVLDTGSPDQAESALTGRNSLVAQAGGTRTQGFEEGEEVGQQEIIKNLVTRRREGLEILLDYENEILTQDRAILDSRTEEATATRTSVEIVGEALALEAQRVQKERAISQRILADQGVEPGSYSADRASTAISGAELNAQLQLLLSQSKAYARSLGEAAVSQDETRRASDVVVNRYRQQNATQIGQEQAARSLTDAQIGAARAAAQAADPKFAEAQASIAASTAEQRVHQQRLLAVLPGYVENLSELAVLQAQQRRQVGEALNADREENAVAIGVANAGKVLTDARIKAAEQTELQAHGPALAESQASATISAADVAAQRDKILAASDAYAVSLGDSAVSQDQTRRASDEALVAYRSANAAQIGQEQATKALTDAQVAAARATALAQDPELARRYALARAATTESEATGKALLDEILAVDRDYLDALGKSAVAHEKERLAVETQTAAYRNANAPQIGKSQAENAAADARVAAERDAALLDNPEYARDEAGRTATGAAQRLQEQRLLAAQDGYIENLAQLAVIQAQERRQVEEALTADRVANVAAIGLADADKTLTDARIKAAELTALQARGPALAEAQASATESSADIAAKRDTILASSQAYIDSLSESAIAHEKEGAEVEGQTAAYRSANAAQLGQSAATAALADAQVAAERAAVLASDPRYAEAQASLTVTTSALRVAQERLLSVLPGYVDDLAELAVLQAQQRREIEEAVDADREANTVAIGLANADRTLTDVRIKAVEAEANLRHGPQLVRDRAQTTIDDASLKADVDQKLAASKSYINSLSQSAVAHEQERVAVQERVAAYRAANAGRIGQAQAGSAEADAKIAAVKAEQLSASKSYLDDVISQKVYSAETALATREALVQMQGFATEAGQTNAAQREVKVAMAERLIKLRQDLAIATEQVALSESVAADDQETLRMKGQLLVANRRLQEATNIEAQAVIDAAEKSGQLGRGTGFQRLEASLARRQGTAPVITEEQATLGQFVGQGALRAVRFGIGATAGFAAIQGLRDSIQEAENLDQALSQTRVTLSAIGQSQDFDKFRGQILAAARDTGTASDQVAVLATQLAATFQNTDVAASNVRTSLQVAKITGADLETTTQQLRAASEGFGLQGSDAFRQISDAAISTANVFGVKAQDIIGFLSGVGAEARQAGLSVQQVAAIGGAIADVSAKSGQTLGDTFARILPQVSAQAEKVAQILRGSQVGSSVADTFVQQVGAGQTGAALETLIANMGKLDYQQQNLVLHTVGGKRETEALTAAVENYQREQQAANNATGSTQQRFESLQHSFKQQLAELLESLKQIGVALADLGLLSMLGDVVSLLRVAADAVGFLGREFSAVNHALGGLPAHILEVVLALRLLNATANGGGGIAGNLIRGVSSRVAGAEAEAEAKAAASTLAPSALSSVVEIPSFYGAAAGTVGTGAGVGAAGVGAEVAAPLAGAGLGGVLGLDAGAALAGAAPLVASTLGVGAALLVGYLAYRHFIGESQKRLAAQVAEWNKTESQKSDEDIHNDVIDIGDQKKNDLGNFLVTPGIGAITGGGRISARARLYNMGFGFHFLATSGSNAIAKQIKEYNAGQKDDQAALQKEIDDDQTAISNSFHAVDLLTTGLPKGDLSKQIADLQKHDRNLPVAQILHKIAENNKLTPEQERALTAALGRITGPDPVQTAQDEVDQASAQLDSLKQQQSEGQPVIPQVLAGYDKLLAAQQGVVDAAQQAVSDNRYDDTKLATAQKALLAAQNGLDQDVANKAKQIEAFADALVDLNINTSQAGGDPAAEEARLQALLSTPNISNGERIKIANDLVAAFRQQQQRELSMANGLGEVQRILNEAIPDAAANTLLTSGLATDTDFQTTKASLSNRALGEALIGPDYTQQVVDLAKKLDESTSKAAIQILEKKRDDIHVLMSLTADFPPGVRESLQRDLDTVNSAIGTLSADPGVSVPADDPQTKIDNAVKAVHDNTAFWKQLQQLAHSMDPAKIAAAEMTQALAEAGAAGLDVTKPISLSDLDTPAKKQAYQDYLQALADQTASAKAIADAQGNVANARLAGDDVGLAEQAKNKAAQDAAAAVGKAEELNAEAERISADNQYHNAMKALFDAQENILIAYANMAGDTVTAARDAQVEAQDAVNRRIQDDIRNGVDQNTDTTLLGLKASLINAQSQSEQAYIQDQRGTIDFELQMHQISTSQAIAQLQALESQVRMTTNNQKDLRDIELQIHQLRSQADQNLQFNLPTDINLPTLYEVRRLNQTPAGQGYVDNRQVSIVFQINNGMDAQTAMRMVTDAVGTTSTTYGTAPKRY